MSNNTRLAELMNYITIDTTSGTQLQVSGSVKQSSVTSALLKANSTGVLVAATAGTDYLTSVGISDLTATGTPSSTTYLRGDNTWATLTIGGTLPAGGTAGQLLSKIDGTDYNTTWIDNFAPQVKHDVKLGATIAKGKAVYVSTSDGTNMVVSAASNASEATSSKVLGLLETGGVTNDIVKVVTEGLVAGLDTSTATAGDPVWLGTGGNLIFGLVNKPVAPAHLVFIGTVTRVQSNNGEIFVNVQNGFEFEELHNLLITSKADKDLVYYDNASSLWKNAQLATILGYTPANDSTVVHIAGAETITGTKVFRGGTTNENPTLSASLLGSTGWATGVTGWTGDYTNGWTIVGTGSSPMTNTQPASSNTFYVVSVTGTTSVTGKYLSITFGGASFFMYFPSTGTQTITVEGVSTNSNSLSISATGFDGTLSAVSVKSRNSTSNAITTFTSSAGLNPIEIRTDNTSGNNNIFFGFDSGKSAYTSAKNNITFGANALKVLQNGSQNIAISNGALSVSITGSYNTAIGYNSLSSNITGGWNTAIGSTALAYNTSSFNTAIGVSSLYNITAGTSNVGIGYNAIYAGLSSSGSYNIGLGNETLYYIGTSSNNVAIGHQALNRIAGSNGSNVAIGYQSGKFISGGSTNATDIANSIFIGYNTFPLANAQTNQIVIGYATVGNGSNTVTIGNSSITANYFSGSINAGSFVKSSGTSSQFLKADGSVDSSTYLTGITSSDVTTALGYTPVTNARTLTINGTAYDLTADRSWTITSMIYPSAGIAVSTGSAWGTSITDNSTNWNTAYTNRITSLTTTGSSGAATLTSNTLNIPNYTLSGLGGQAALNGTGFVKISGTTISYDNSTYLTSYTETSTLANVTARGATTNSSITVNGYITVTGAGTSSSIYMSDSDNGQREMHCNSDRIGFLTQAGGWGSYCNDDGSWVSVSDITAYSDERIKENIETVDNALEKTLNLRGVYYNRTDIADKSRKLGVIAQEIQKVIPEIVHEEADGLLGVSYGNMVGLFIEAFKELNAKVISQDIQIAELKKLLNK